MSVFQLRALTIKERTHQAQIQTYIHRRGPRRLSTLTRHPASIRDIGSHILSKYCVQAQDNYFYLLAC